MENTYQYNGGTHTSIMEHIYQYNREHIPVLWRTHTSIMERTYEYNGEHTQIIKNTYQYD